MEVSSKVAAATLCVSVPVTATKSEHSAPEQRWTSKLWLGGQSEHSPACAGARWGLSCRRRRGARIPPGARAHIRKVDFFCSCVCCVVDAGRGKYSELRTAGRYRRPFAQPAVSGLVAHIDWRILRTRSVSTFWTANDPFTGFLPTALPAYLGRIPLGRSALSRSSAAAMLLTCNAVLVKIWTVLDSLFGDTLSGSFPFATAELSA